VIIIEEDAPLASPWWHGGYTGSSGSPSGPSDGGGGGGGSGSVPSGGGTTALDRQKRLAAAKNNCRAGGGAWGPAEFNDWVTNIRFSGYSCVYNNGPRKGDTTWVYVDSEGYYNHYCAGTREVQTCEQ